MNRSELEAKILELVSMSYNKDVETLSLDTRIREDLGGTSVLMVGLVSEIENELDVMVQLADAASFKTIADLVNKVEELL